MIKLAYTYTSIDLAYTIIISTVLTIISVIKWSVNFIQNNNSKILQVQLNVNILLKSKNCVKIVMWSCYNALDILTH